MKKESDKETMRAIQLTARIRQGFDNYRLSTLLSLPLALAGLIALGVMAYLGADDLLKVGALITDFVIIPAFVGRLISASSYLGRIFDAFSRSMRIQQKGYAVVGEETKLVVSTLLSSKVEADRLIGPYEAWVTLVGVLLGIGFGVAAAVLLGPAIPFTASFAFVAYPLYVGGFIGLIAGLFNRIGLILDNGKALLRADVNSNRDKTELRIMLLGASLGLVAAIALLATSSASLAIISGLTPFITMSVFPLPLAAVVFTLIAMSVFASAADYIAKSVTYVRSYFDRELSTKLTDTKRVMHEYRGSFIGVSLGTALGVGVTVALALTTSILSGPLMLPLVGGLLITLTTIGVLGGLAARIARLVDRLIPAVGSATAPTAVADRALSPSSSSSPRPPSPPVLPTVITVVRRESVERRRGSEIFSKGSSPARDEDENSCLMALGSQAERSFPNIPTLSPVTI